MNPFTSLWLSGYQARQAPAVRLPAPPSDDLTESELHRLIIQECRRRDLEFIHARMDRRTTTGKGVCDFVIYADRGRVFHVECKSSDGRLTTEQVLFISKLSRLGHTVDVVNSFAGFLEVVRP